MTTKLSNIVALNSAGLAVFLEALSAIRATKQSAKAGLWLIQFSRRCQTLFADFHEQRNILLARYGKDVETPGKFIIPADNVEDFNAEMNSLEADIDLELPEGVKLKWPEEFIVDQLAPLVELDIFTPLEA